MLWIIFQSSWDCVQIPELILHKELREFCRKENGMCRAFLNRLAENETPFRVESQTISESTTQFRPLICTNLLYY